MTSHALARRWMTPLLCIAIATTSTTSAHAQASRDSMRFSSPTSLPPAHGYSQMADVPNGRRLLFLSGQIALDSAGQLIGAGDMRLQARQVFENMRRALVAAGGTMSDLVKLNYFVVDASQAGVIREERDRVVNTVAPPASTLVEVRRLFRPDLLIEVDAVAAVPA